MRVSFAKMSEPVDVASIVSRATESSSRDFTNSTSQVLPVASPIEAVTLIRATPGTPPATRVARAQPFRVETTLSRKLPKVVSKMIWVPSGAALPSWKTWALTTIWLRPSATSAFGKALGRIVIEPKASAVAARRMAARRAREDRIANRGLGDRSPSRRPGQRRMETVSVREVASPLSPVALMLRV